MRRFFFCLLFLAFSACAPALADDQWMEVTSPHFQVITDAGEKRGREVLERFEQIRVGFGLLFSKVNVNVPVPLTIVAFRSTKEMRHYSFLFNGKPVEVAGFYQMGEDRNFIALDLSSENGWEVVFHEYAHMLINSALPPMPPWFDEGFAEYCASLKMEGKQFKIGEVLPGRGDELSRGNWMKVEQLFAVSHNSRDYNEGDRRSIFYAESWLVVHYLYTNHQVPNVANYMHLVRDEHMAIPQAIHAAFGMSAADMDHALDHYFHGRATYFYVAAPAMEKVSTEARALAPLDAQSELADLHYHTLSHREEGVREFEEILKQQPDNMLANRGLGYAYLRQGELAKAAECFRRASEKGSNDPRVHLFTAMLLMQQRSARDEDSDATGARIIAEARRALELKPQLAEAWELLGIAYQQGAPPSDNLQEAAKALAQAAALEPRNETYRLNLASCHLRAGEFEKARAELSGLQNSAEPGVAAQAGQMLLVLDARNNPDRFSQFDEAVARQRANTKAAGQANASPAPAGPAVKVVEVESTAPPILERRPAPSSENPEEYSAPAPTPAVPLKVAYAKGKLLSMDCKASSADLGMLAGGKTLRIRVDDITRVVVIGADKFSCGWLPQTELAVNYRILPDGSFSAISIEVH